MGKEMMWELLIGRDLWETLKGLRHRAVGQKTRRFGSGSLRQLLFPRQRCREWYHRLVCSA